jgi:alkyl-hydroperoxide reductase/thiol specific antioxidant family protein
LRDRYQELTAKGAGVAVIAAGFPAMAKDFQQEYRLPFPVLVDTPRATYAALGLKRDSPLHVTWTSLRELALLRGAFKLARHGVGAPKPRQDVLQLGGALVVAPGGKVKLVHRATEVSDNVPVDALLEALG